MSVDGMEWPLYVCEACRLIETLRNLDFVWAAAGGGVYILDVLSVALGDLGFFYIAVDIAIVVQKFSIRIAESRNHAMSRSDSRVASSAIPVENFCINFAIQRNIEEPSRP